MCRPSFLLRRPKSGFRRVAIDSPPRGVHPVRSSYTNSTLCFAFLFGSNIILMVYCCSTSFSARSRLKGCEAEVAALLSDRWSHVTLDWHRSQSDDANGEMNGDYGP